MKANIEHLVSVVRAGPDADDPYARYEVAITLRWRNPSEVELVGVDKPPTLSHLHAMWALLYDQGVRDVVFERAGKWHRHRLDMTKSAIQGRQTGITLDHLADTS